MAKIVIKKDGTKQPFDESKIRKAIAMAVQQTDLPDERRGSIVEQVSNSVIGDLASKDEVLSSEIRGIILGQLAQLEPSIVESWKKHEATKDSS